MVVTRRWHPSKEFVSFLKNRLPLQRVASHPQALFRSSSFLLLFQHFYDANRELQSSYEETQRTYKWFGDHLHKKNPEMTLSKFHRGIDQMTHRMVHLHEPLAYILGTQPFGPLEIKCKKPILIPRPETEALTEYVAKIIVKEGYSKEHGFASSTALPLQPLKILDLCCGTGCIGILLRHRLMDANMSATITAVDVARGALLLTRQNVIRQNQSFKINHNRPDSNDNDIVSEEETKSTKGKSRKEPQWNEDSVVKFDLRKADLFVKKDMEDLIWQDGPFDLVISNPPYITSEDMKSLEKSVRDWESPRALCGDLKCETEGLSFYRRIADIVMWKSSLLGKSTGDLPNLVLEVGKGQAHKVQELLNATGVFKEIRIWTDPFNVARGIVGWKSS